MALAPAVSHFDETVSYDSHELTSDCHIGENVVSVVFFEIGCADDEKETTASDPSWKVTVGPITFDGLRNGEQYDARLELGGWNLPGYNDQQSDNAQIVRSPVGSLKSAQLPPIKQIEELELVSATEIEPGSHLFDFGKSVSGRGKLMVAAQPRTEVVLRHGESLNENGTVDTGSTGLRWICEHGGEIYHVKKRVKWPGMAAVVLSVVHVMKGLYVGTPWIDSRKVENLTAFLFHRGGNGDPARLAENNNKTFNGSYVLGMGFTFDDTDAKGIASQISEMRWLIMDYARN